MHHKMQRQEALIISGVSSFDDALPGTTTDVSSFINDATSSAVSAIATLQYRASQSTVPTHLLRQRLNTTDLPLDLVTPSQGFCKSAALNENIGHCMSR